MIGGSQPQGEPGCSGPYAAPCNSGYAAALSSFQYAAATPGVNPLVTWWLDVEPDQSWSSDPAANAATVQGAINALRDQGINNVGVYTSPGTWNGIVGNYQPAVPTWIAWWTNDGPSNCANIAAYAAAHNDRLPTGPVWITQYTSQANGQSLDGDYAC
jgi:GH25 family lysozyme M1 (1,4-beta-N-acetylmuramidase)